MSQLCWQHAKIISPNKNPPERSRGVINVNSLAHRDGIDLGPALKAKALQTVNVRFLNFQETPFKAWVMSVWTWTDPKSFDGYPLWTTIAWILGLQLYWILCLRLVHTKLMRLDFLKTFLPGQSYEHLNMDGSKILWRVPFLHNHSLDPRSTIVLDRVPRASAHQALGFWIYEKFHSRLELWVFE